ncbi:MAG: DMT family transporter [Planctomycetota bacterium]
MSSKVWIIVLVLAAGASWPIQSAVNGQLKVVTKSPFIASLANGAGAAILAGLVLLVGGILLKQVALPGAAEYSRVPWWAWGGGLFSVLVIVAQSTGAHHLGTASLISLFVVAQSVSALVVDHFGLLGIPHKPVNTQRLVGVGMLVVGSILVTRATSTTAAEIEPVTQPAVDATGDRDDRQD